MSEEMGVKAVYSPAEVSARVAKLGREISRDYAGRTLDVIVILENAFVFAADLVRRIEVPVVCHFVRSMVRDFELAGHSRREIFFSHPPNLEGCDVLIVDAVLHTGVTQDFLLKRLQEDEPRSVRLAVLIDRPSVRKVDVKPDYFGFATASNQMVGYGLSSGRGLDRNLPFLGEPLSERRRASARRAVRIPERGKGNRSVRKS